MKITYDAEADALSVVFAETTVTTQHLADGIAADYDEADVWRDWKSWTFAVASAVQLLFDASSWKASAAWFPARPSPTLEY